MPYLIQKNIRLVHITDKISVSDIGRRVYSSYHGHGKIIDFDTRINILYPVLVSFNEHECDIYLYDEFGNYGVYEPRSDRNLKFVL